MSTFAVLGAGLMGRVVAKDLLDSEPDARVTLLDRDDTLLGGAIEFVAHPGLTATRVDMLDVDLAARTVAGHDAAVAALPHRLSLTALEIAIRGRVPIVDLVGEAPETRVALDERAQAADIVIIPGCGVAPGLSNVFVGQGVDRLDDARDAAIYVGGIPRTPRPPLEYETVYALESVFGACLRPARVFEQGREAEVEVLSGLERLEFADPVGSLEAYFTDGLGSLVVTMAGRITGSLVEKTLRYPGFAERVSLLLACGLLERAPVRVGAVDVAPFDVLITQLGGKLQLGPDGDLLVMRVVVSGTTDGRPDRHVFELIDAYDPVTGYTAMGRTTGFPAALAARMIASGEIAERGVRFPEQLFVGALGDRFVDSLRQRGLAIRCRHDAPGG